MSEASYQSTPYQTRTGTITLFNGLAQVTKKASKGVLFVDDCPEFPKSQFEILTRHSLHSWHQFAYFSIFLPFFNLSINLGCNRIVLQALQVAIKVHKWVLCILVLQPATLQKVPSLITRCSIFFCSNILLQILSCLKTGWDFQLLNRFIFPLHWPDFFCIHCKNMIHLYIHIKENLRKFQNLRMHVLKAVVHLGRGRRALWTDLFM